MIRPVDSVAAMAAYALADLDSDAFSLAQNESFLPPSPKVLTAFAKHDTNHALYPDPDWTDLRTAIGQHHALPADQILCGAGSMELIGALIRTFSGPGDSVLASQYAYAFVSTACLQAGSTRESCPESDFTVDVDTLLAHTHAPTRIVFVANPGNPTGTRLPNTELIRLRDALPDDVLLIVDEAYGEFDESSADALWPLIARGNTVITRSFSKAYALAGARVGWCALSPTLATHVRKLLNPNNVSRASQAAALAAVQDQQHLAYVVNTTAAARDHLQAALRRLGVEVPESNTNFVLAVFPDHATSHAVNTALRSEGLYARAMDGYGLAHALRITVADAASMQQVADLVEETLR
ncbi:MAG: histidinol-phosphate transaminase [Pseudomonadota bacterium]